MNAWEIMRNVVVVIAIVGVVELAIGYAKWNATRSVQIDEKRKCQFPYCHERATRVLNIDGTDYRFCRDCADDASDMALKRGKIRRLIGFVESDEEPLGIGA